MADDICASCTEESTNSNYTINGGRVFVCARGGNEKNMGECGVQSLNYKPTYVEHYRGRDGQFDAAIPVRADFELRVTIHEITPINLATALGVDLIPTADGCMIPFKKPNCGRHYGVRFEHQFPCANKWLHINLWAALVLGEFTLEFGDTIVEFPIVFRATDCASLHPTCPFGNIEIQTVCYES